MTKAPILKVEGLTKHFPVHQGLFKNGGSVVRAVDQDWRSFLVTAITIAIVLRTRLNPLWLIAAGAILGITQIV